MPYEAVFFRTLPGDSSLGERFDSGAFRATAVLRTGPYAAVAFTPLDATAPRLASACLPGDPLCDNAVLLPVLSHISVHRPAEVIALILAQIRPGGLRRWASQIRRHVADNDAGGLSVGVAYLHGIESANALIELVGDDVERVNELMLDLVDREDVEDFQVLHALPEDTRGFGAPQRAQLS